MKKMQNLIITKFLNLFYFLQLTKLGICDKMKIEIRRYKALSVINIFIKCDIYIYIYIYI